MKRVMLVICLLVMSLFVSGYTYDVEMNIKSDNTATIKKSFSMDNDDIKKSICGGQECAYTEDDVRLIASKYIISDVTNEKVKHEDNIKITSEAAKIEITYDLGELDNHVGHGYDPFDLLYSNFNKDLFTIDGLRYKSNFIFTKEDNLTKGSFKLTLPNKVESSNATYPSDSKFTYEWDLTITSDISFVYKANNNIEVTGDREYGKIKFNKYMFIGLGVIVGLIVILAFVNILKKDKALMKDEEPVNNTPIYNSEIFNERASITTPESMSDENNTFKPLDESLHEDKISNKFMDDSFAGSTSVEESTKIEEPKPSESVLEPTTLGENIIEEPPKEEPIIEENNVEEAPIQNDMSSLAFGGAPTEDKNINEIE